MPFGCKLGLICAYFSPDSDEITFSFFFTGESNIMDRRLENVLMMDFLQMSNSFSVYKT